MSRLVGRLTRYIAIVFVSLSLPSSIAVAQDEQPPPAKEAMTVDQLNNLIVAVDEKATKINDFVWGLTVADVPVNVIADPRNDRMRIVVGVSRLDDVPEGTMLRLLQANFDSALDARYAISGEILWSVFIHPLGALEDELFLSGLGQTVNLARTYGSTYTSGALIFGGGDSQGLIERELIEELIRRGKAI